MRPVLGSSLSLGLVALLVVALVAALWGRAGRGEGALVQSPPQPAVAEATRVDLAPAPPPESRRADPPSRAAVPAAPPGEVSPGAAATTPVRVTGHWSVIDELGATRGGEDGRFTLRVFSPRSDLRVSVNAGRWDVELPPEAEFDILDLELGGRTTAPIDDVTGLDVSVATHFELAARWPRPIILTVVDVTTRAELTDITVVDVETGEPRLHPGALGSESVLAHGASSPVVLPVPPRPRAQQRLCVRAPGYGWSTIAVPAAVGGEFLLALRPGGALGVEVIGARRDVAFALRLRTDDDPEHWEGVLQDEPLAGRARVDFEALPSGHYYVTLELGHRYRSPRILAQRELELRAAESLEVTLDVSSFRPPAQAGVSGVLVVPREWELADFGLHFTLVGQPAADGTPQRYVGRGAMQPMGADGSEYAFAIEDLQPGAWEVRFNPIGTTRAVDVPPGGLAGVRIEVPAPARVAVVVHGDESDAPLDDVQLHWMPDRTGLASGGVLNSVAAGPDGVFRFTTPAGPIDVWCLSKRWAPRRQTLRVQPGANEFELETTLACGLVLGVRDADTRLRVDAFEPVITGIGDGGGTPHLIDEDDAGLALRFAVPAPGRYCVALTAPPGYAPIEPFELDVPARSFVERTVEVRRD